MATIKQSKLSKSARKARNRLRKALSTHISNSKESNAALAKQLGVPGSVVTHLAKNTNKKELTIDELITLLDRAGLLAKVAVKNRKTKKKKPTKSAKKVSRKAGARKVATKKKTKKKTAKKKTATRKVSSRKKTTARKKAVRKKTVARKKTTQRRKTKKKATKKKTRRKSASKKRTTKKRSAKKAGGRTPLFKAPSGAKDNLQRIKGVGPGMERTLNRLGITKFTQIARFKASDVNRVADAIGSFGGRVKSDGWVKQAGVLAGGGETAFSKRVDKGKVSSSRRKRR